MRACCMNAQYKQGRPVCKRIHAPSEQLVCILVQSIDPMRKWRSFKYSFVYIQISPTSLILGNIFF